MFDQAPVDANVELRLRCAGKEVLSEILDLPGIALHCDPRLLPALRRACTGGFRGVKESLVGPWVLVDQHDATAVAEQGLDQRRFPSGLRSEVHDVGILGDVQRGQDPGLAAQIADSIALLLRKCQCESQDPAGQGTPDALVYVLPPLPDQAIEVCIEPRPVHRTCSFRRVDAAGVEFR